MSNLAGINHKSCELYVHFLWYERGLFRASSDRIKKVFNATFCLTKWCTSYHDALNPANKSSNKKKIVSI